MSALATSRRVLLGSLALLPAAALPSVALTAPAADRTAWARAMRAYEAASAASEAYTRDVAEPAYARRDVLAPYPASHFEIVARNGSTARYPFYPSRPHEYDDHVGTQFREAAARLRRQWDAYEETNRSLGIGPIVIEEDRLDELRYDAEWALIYMPAPDGSALLWKLHKLFGPDRREEDSAPCWSGKVLDTILADARRLLGGEVQA